MAGLQDLAWLRLNAALRHEVPTFKWATVHTSSPGLTIILEGDESHQPRQVSANAVGPLTAGQRVRVEMQGTRITVTAAQMSGFLMPDGDVDIISPLGAHLHLGTGVRLYSSAGSGHLAIFQTGQVTLYGPASNQWVNLLENGQLELRSPNARIQMGTSVVADADVSFAFTAGNNIGLNTGTGTVTVTRTTGAGRLQINDAPTTTAAANAHISAAGSVLGLFYRSTSVRAAKAEIRDLPFDTDDYLALQPRDWIDRTALEAEQAGDTDGGVSPRTRIPGLVAEEVAESGNEWLVQRDDEGNLTNVSYDRGWVPLIPIVRNLRAQVSEQARQLEAQESRIAMLEEQVAALQQQLEQLRS